MTAFFSYLSGTVIASFLLVTALMVIRASFPRLPRKYLCFLWALIMARILIPIRFTVLSGPVPVLSFSFENGGVESVTVESYLSLFTSSAEGSAASLSFSAPLPLSSVLLSSLFAAWVAGTAFLLLYWVFGCVKVLKTKQNSYKAESNIYRSEEIRTPFTFGLFHPFIIVPKDVSAEDYNLVIMHERIHIQRKDSLWKSIGFMVLAFFWFNPFIWIAYLAFSQDIEMACDEAVSDKLPNERANYALSLLRFSSSSDIRISSFGGKAVRKRIAHIFAYRKLCFRDALCFMPVLLLFLLLFFITPQAASATAEKMPEINSLEDRILTESPLLYVKAAKGSRKAVVGSSSWHFTKDGKNWDGIERDITLDQIRALLAQTSPLEGNDFSLFCPDPPKEIRVGFLTKPDYLHSNFYEMHWNDASPLSFSLPSEAYLVIIYAEWSGEYCEGSGYYYFLRS